MDFQQSDLRALAAMTDEIGVLSVYVTADPREESSTRPAWQTRIRGELAALREKVKNEYPREQWTAFDKRLTELEPILHRLLQAAEPGLGRAMFAAIAGGSVQTLKVQLPVPDLVVLDSAACVRPLVRVAAMGAPAGVVAVSQDGLRLIDIRYGKAEEVQKIDLSVDMDDWRQMSGPAGTNPAHGQQNVSMTDRFNRRIEDNLGRLLRQTAGEVAGRMSLQSWRRLLIAGDMRLVDTLSGELPNEIRDKIIKVDRIVYPLSASQVADSVCGVLDEARLADEDDLAVRARDAAASGNAGVSGLSDTLGALVEGRVAHLLLDENGEWSGAKAPDGRLVGDSEVPPGISADELVPEPHLGDRMIERALANGADVTLLGDKAGSELAQAGGVAALLRW